MEKIKRFIESEAGKDILIIFIVILVGLGSFELGRLSKQGSGGIKIEYPAGQAYQPANASSAPLNILPPTINTDNKGFFASNRGKKYYTTGCEAGKSIVKENRVYFDTSAQAEQAGYARSSSCK